MTARLPRLRTIARKQYGIGGRAWGMCKQRKGGCWRTSCTTMVYVLVPDDCRYHSTVRRRPSSKGVLATKPNEVAAREVSSMRRG